MANLDAPDMPIEPPITVEDPNAVVWNAHADVVVVGIGGAGLCAALQAVEMGGTVIALDRFDGGGATRFSGGVVYAGGGTTIQKEAGVTDTPEEMTKYLMLEVGDAASEETVRRYSEESAANLEWLIKNGAKFGSTFWKEKIAYPPEGYFLQYSGNEKAYAAHAVPAARGHRTVGTGFSGVFLYDALRKSAEAKGVKIFKHCPATRLVVDGSGRVVGVEGTLLPEGDRAAHQLLYDKVDPMTPFNGGIATRAAREAVDMEARGGRKIRVRARNGIILSTGGFTYSSEMLQEHVPAIAPHVLKMLRMASLACNGAGIRLGQSAGGATAGLDHLYIGRVMSPPASFIHGILVNNRGVRFEAEDAYNSILGGAIRKQPGGEAYLILTRRDFYKSIRESLFSGWATFRYFGGAALLNILFGGTRQGGTIAKLARKLAIDPATLEKTIAHYNQTIGSEDEFGKLPSGKVPIEDSSYIAVNFSIANAFAFHQVFTQGGLRIDEHSGEVKATDGKVISGLYAAGRTAFGMCSNNYVSGLAIGDCVFTGRRAARHAMGGTQ